MAQVRYQGWRRKKGGQYEKIPDALGSFREVYDKIMSDNLRFPVDEWDCQAVKEGEIPKPPAGKREIRPGQYYHRQMRAQK